MSEFQKIAEELISISKKVIQLIKTKKEYAKNINYQISQLFMQLGESIQQQNTLLLDTINLKRQLNAHQLNILFCRDNRQSSYITPEDLCTFLHISKHNLKRKNDINSLEQTLINQFYSLVESQEQIEEQLINSLSQISLETWFAEVDFFNNGYIDTSALYEYFMHYDSKQQIFEEYNSLIILKIIKRHSLSDKLFLQDIKHFLQRNDVIHIFLTNQQLSPVKSIKIQKKELDRHIKQKSNQMQSLQSQMSIAPDIKIGPKLVQQNNYHSHSQTFSLMSREHIQQELKQEQSITFQQRLIKLHARNENYIREAKRQMEGIIPICNIQIQSHMQVQTFKSNSAQLIRSIRLFGDIYNKIVKLIQVFLSKNVKFTFINAFSLLDVNENNAVGLRRWIQFVKEYEINVSVKKLTIFYGCYSCKSIMNYSNFLKIFKYYSLQDEFIRCSMRYALIYEKWSDELTQNYKIFMTKIIRLVQQRQAFIQNILKQQQQLQILLKSFTFIDEITQILGQQYRQFARQYFQQQNEQLICKFLSNSTHLL